jgi:succinoglycan biosynthesis protein ExoW
MNLAVIIPYFQRQPGLLRRAVASILEQRLEIPTQVKIIVVDDGSPLPAKTDLTGLNVGPPFELVLIEKANAGVSSARNTALATLGNETDLIGFLDSDDFWTRDHLLAAFEAFTLGADFFFCDSKRENEQHTSFTEKAFADFIAQYGRLAGGKLYELDHDAFFDQSLKGRMFLTPSVVYRRSVKPELRFDETLKLAGEDCLYFFETISASKRIFCTSELHVLCGHGVNIHAGRFGWDNPGNLALHMAQLVAVDRWRQILRLSDPQQRFLEGRLKHLRALFAFLSIRRFLKGSGPWSDELRSLVKSDRHFLFWYPAYVIYVGLAYPTKRYDPLGPW